MQLTAIIGGSGFDAYTEMTVDETLAQKTPYGNHSGPVLVGRLANTPCVFLPRHTLGHTLPPHRVNYRANLWLLKQLGVTHIIACNVVGGINPMMPPNTLVIPHQVIDYTYSREHTFYDGQDNQHRNPHCPHLSHIDFSRPYHEALRKKLIAFFNESHVHCLSQGVYGCTQGPRLETTAEIERLQRDGCDMVGMTGMPEAALAKEIGIDYAAIAVVVNWAAGITEDTLSMTEIIATIQINMVHLKALIPSLVSSLAKSGPV